jgi:hypothetical protein
MCSSPPAGLAGDLFDNSHKTIAPARQPRPYIRSCVLRSVGESTYRNIARKTKGWIKHKIRHIALTRDGKSLFRNPQPANALSRRSGRAAATEPVQRAERKKSPDARPGLRATKGDASLSFRKGQI